MRFSAPSLDSQLYGISLAFVVGALLFVGPAAGQGFGVYEQGTCVMGRAGATVADGCGDGSSIYFNPANLAGSEGVTASIGGTIIDAYGDFTYDNTTNLAGTEVELQNDPILVPHGYVTYGLNEDLAVGIGAYVPYGLETNWPTQLSNGTYFDGAFEGFNNRVQSIYVQPTASYQLTPRLRVGGGAIVAISSVELNQLQDFSQVEVPVLGIPFQNLGVPFHTAFARSKLEADNEVGFGANIGATYEATDRLSIGVRFTTPITVSYDGNASFTQVETGIIFPPSSPLAQDLPTDGNQDGNPDPTPADLLLASQFDSEGVLEGYQELANSEGQLALRASKQS